MSGNRSVPANILLPHIVHDDVAKAIDWLTCVFGFEEHYRYGNPAQPAGAQMRFAYAYFMLSSARPGRSTPAQLGAETQSLTVFVPDVEAHFQRAKAAGAQFFEELHVTEYGEHQYGAIDLAGHRWLFSNHARDVNPEEWGATVAHKSSI
ncbi:MAG: VOC family protein [Terriglobales bacterium]